jgi:hypothetical protein
MSNFTSLSLLEQATLQCDDHDIRFLLDQHPYLDFIAHRYNYPRGHVTLNPSQQVFVLNCTSLAETKTNRNLMVRIAHLLSFVFCVFLFCLSSSCVLCTQCCQSLDCSFVIAPSVFSNVYYCLWIDPTGTRTHDIPHSRKHANHHTTDVVRLIFNNHFDNPLTILQKI